MLAHHGLPGADRRQAQLNKFLGHTRPAAAARVQPMLFPDLRQANNIAPVKDGPGPAQPMKPCKSTSAEGLLWTTNLGFTP